MHFNIQLLSYHHTKRSNKAARLLTCRLSFGLKKDTKSFCKRDKPKRTEIQVDTRTTTKKH